MNRVAMEPVPWPIPSSSSSRKRKREHYGRTRIVIPLHTKPKDYVPGSGPPMQPPRLLPPHDSTAYILDRILLASPGFAKDGKPLPKRMAYLVGWTDLPAARMFVPAMDILEYVSPYALEEWEWQMELELDEERAKMEKEATQEVQKPKRRGRPPKHSQIEAAVVAEPEPEHIEAEWSKKGVMSVTTPTKPRLKSFGGLSDEVRSPSRQIEEELLQGAMIMDSNETSEEPETTDFQTEAEPLSDHMELDPVAKTSSPSKDSADVPWLSRNPQMTSLQTEGFSSTATSSRRSTPKSSTIGKRASKIPRTSPVPSTPRDTSLYAEKQTGKQPEPVIHQHASFTPAGHGPRTPALELETPLWETAASGPSQLKSSTKARSQKSAQKPKKQKTPKPKPEPQLRAKEVEGEAAGGEAQWEVKRLEDVEFYEVEGRGLVRYFKVLWEGDWPPEQNPSWEPEDNLPPNLVRNFFKRGKKKAAAPTPLPKKKTMKQTTLSWTNGKQYKSVSEAFAGGADDDGLDELVQDEAEQPHEEEDEQDELFVVEEPGKDRPRPSWNTGTASKELGMFSMYR